MMNLSVAIDRHQDGSIGDASVWHGHREATLHFDTCARVDVRRYLVRSSTPTGRHRVSMSKSWQAAVRGCVLGNVWHPNWLCREPWPEQDPRGISKMPSGVVPHHARFPLGMALIGFRLISCLKPRPSHEISHGSEHNRHREGRQAIQNKEYATPPLCLCRLHHSWLMRLENRKDEENAPTPPRPPGGAQII